MTDVDETICLRCIKMIDEQVCHLEYLLKDPAVVASEKKSFQTSQIDLFSIGQKIGDGSSKEAGVETVQDQNVVWDDAESAFQNCIRSGVITNLKHIDPTAFLSDSFSLFEEKVKLALDELDSIHVDAIFSGEFKLFKK